MNSFSLIILLACVVGVLSISEANKEKSKDVAAKCMIGLSQVDEQKIRLNDFATPSRDIKCFLDCFNEGTGFTKNSTIQEPLALDVLSGEPGLTAEKIKGIIATCAKTKIPDKCENAYKMLTCFNENKAKIMP